MASQKALEFARQQYPWLQPVLQNGLPTFAAVPGLGELPSPDDPLYGAWLGLQSPDIQAALAGTFGYSQPAPPAEEYTPFQQAIAEQYDTATPAGQWRAQAQAPLEAYLNPGAGAGGYWPGSGPGYGGAASGLIDFGGDYQNLFYQLFPDETLTPAMLRAKEGELARYGITLAPNAEGVAGKVRLPTGQIIDVIQGASSGVNRRQWLLPESAGGGGGAGGFSDPNAPGGYTEPFREAFSYAEFAPPEDFVAPTWTAPETVGDFNDPGYSARLAEGQKALERAASAKGTLLTGGTAKGLQQFGQDYAANEYQNVYNRRYGEYQSDYAKKWGEYLQNYQQQAGEWETGYNKALGEYQQRYGIFQNNQGNAYTRMLGVAQLGLQGTNAQAQLGAGYAQNYGNILGNYGNTLELITGAGNATAAGQAGAGSAWGNAFGNIGNLAGQSLYGYQLLNNLGAGGTAGWHGVR